jgi:hypothetical protein
MKQVNNKTHYYKEFEEINNGFVEITDFINRLNSLKQECGVYIFVYGEKINRLVGSSPILKIGETINFRKRMRRYFHENEIENIKNKINRQTAYRLRDFIKNHAEYEIKLYFKECPNFNKEDLRKEEYRLLSEYIEKHKEVPPLNMGLH